MGESQKDIIISLTEGSKEVSRMLVAMSLGGMSFFVVVLFFHWSVFVLQDEGSSGDWIHNSVNVTEFSTLKNG